MNGYGRNSGFLEVTNGSLAGMAFPLQRAEMNIGRLDDNDIVIPDPMVSGRHARLTVRSDAIILDDLGSSNGTVVNGIRIQSHILQEGDRIFLGSTELIFHAGDSAPISAMAPAAGAASAAGGAGGSKRVPIIIGTVVGMVIIIIALVVAVFIFKGKEEAKDVISPEVELIKPESGKRYEMPLNPGATAQVEIELKASDDKGINKVELYVGGEVVKIFKKEESSPYRYTFTASSPGDYSIYAVAYDDAGNQSDSRSVNVTVWLDQGKKVSVETYEQQVSACIAEFNQYRPKMNQLKATGRGLAPADPAWVGVYEGFESIYGGLNTLQSKAGSFLPTNELKPSQAELLETIAALANASEKGMTWARDSGFGLPTASDHLSRYNQFWGLCDQHRASFNVVYEQAIMGLLGRPPYVRF